MLFLGIALTVAVIVLVYRMRPYVGASYVASMQNRMTVQVMSEKV